jgi:hypothetical protein
MDQPNKDKKKKANGDVIGATEELKRTPEQKRTDKLTRKRSTTTEGKEHMAKVGVNLDKSGNASANKEQKIYIEGDREKGIKPKTTTGSGKLVKEAKKGDKPGTLKKEYDRGKKYAEGQRQKQADVHNMQTKEADNEATKRALSQNKAGDEQKKKLFKKPR